MFAKDASLWSPVLASKLMAALNRLLESAYYAQDCSAPPAQFAVEIDDLHADGLRANDIRWLIAKEYVAHMVESTEPGGVECRVVQRAQSQPLSMRSCFILTRRGIAFAREVCRSQNSRHRFAINTAPHRHAIEMIVPLWDAHSRMLWFGPKLIKRYTVPASNQELVLAAFQEQQWPSCIDDPLPRADEIDPKRRLHDTLTRLNRSHESRVIRFRGNGNGRGIGWLQIHCRHSIAARSPILGRALPQHPYGTIKKLGTNTLLCFDDGSSVPVVVQNTQLMNQTARVSVIQGQALSQTIEQDGLLVSGEIIAISPSCKAGASNDLGPQPSKSDNGVEIAIVDLHGNLWTVYDDSPESAPAMLVSSGIVAQRRLRDLEVGEFLIALCEMRIAASDSAPIARHVRVVSKSGSPQEAQAVVCLLGTLGSPQISTAGMLTNGRSA